MRTDDGLSVISRAFRLLAAFESEAGELTLEELTGASGLSRSTAHRLAGQLVDEGALERSARGWRLGTRLFELGQRVVSPRRLRDNALPYMQDLFAATGETVQLAVADANEVLYVEIISGHRKVPSPSRRGGRMPLHCTALGKVLLAFSPAVHDGWKAAGIPLSARTRATITDMASLAAELQAIRDDQLAYDREEAAVGLQCVAAPILNRAGRATAALSVSMPAGGRLSPTEVAPAVRTVARSIMRTAPRP